MIRFLKPVFLLFFALTTLLSFSPRDVINETFANQSKDNGAYEKENTKNNLVRVINIRKYSGENYTRIAIDLEREAEFKYHRIKSPDRVYVDISGAWLDSKIKNNFISIGDGILKKIRTGYFEPTTVRIVMELESLETFK